MYNFILFEPRPAAERNLDMPMKTLRNKPMKTLKKPMLNNYNSSARSLLRAAKSALASAYAPYSGSAAGCALLGTDGVIYTGVTVENAVQSVSVCAERAAVCKAVSRGCRSFSAIAVVGVRGGMCVPCGTCRQTLAEFSPNLTVVLEDEEKNAVTYKLSDLLPNTFNLKLS
jgi:cytidine deaminase